MNRNQLKKYAPQARRDFIKTVTDRAAFYGLTKEKIAPVTEQGDMAIIGGKPFSRDVAEKRKRLEDRIGREGFEQVMEAMAYTWFNRFVAIRFMELHGYLEHGYRVLSTTDYTDSTDGKDKKTVSAMVPDILKYAEHVDLPELNQNKVVELKLAGNRDEELYRMLLIAQCNALHKAMPFLFEWIGDATELLLPENLLHSDSLIRKMVNEIPEDEWGEVEIIGWLYQFYISEKKDQVIGKVVKSEDIPSATQLFTPNWIVKYMVQNTLGRQWVATYPSTPLKQQMEYYIEPAEQTPEVQVQLKAITPESLNPEKLTLLDPACGSGHILVEAYDLVKAIYQERGYRAKDIPRLILEKNLYGLEIDDRATQLAAFALMMKARADDRRIFDNGTKPHVLAIQESKGMDAEKIAEALNAPIVKGELPTREMLFEEMDEARSPLFSRKSLSVKGEVSQDDMAQLIQLFEHGKIFGSLIRVPEELNEKLVAIAERIEDVLAYGEMFGKAAAETLRPIVEQAGLLAGKYDCVVTNPPYMGGKGMNSRLKSFLQSNYTDVKSDLFSAFILRNTELALPKGQLGFMSPFVWMFISSYEKLRKILISQKTITSLVQLEYSGFDGATVPICTFTVENAHHPEFKGGYVRLFDFRGAENQGPKTLEAIKNPKCGWFYRASAVDFKKIPGSPIAYWLKSKIIESFLIGKMLGNLVPVRGGMTTGDNDRFVRLWHEVSLSKFTVFEAADKKTWFPYNKGGEYRKWFGNRLWIVDWEDNGAKIKATGRASVRSEDLYFEEMVGWTDVTSYGQLGVRFYGNGFIFDASGPAIFPSIQTPASSVLGFLGSKIASIILQALNATLHVQAGNISSLPLLKVELRKRLDSNSNVLELINLARKDWDSQQTSWDFTKLPLLQTDYLVPNLESTYTKLRTHWQAMTLEMQRLEGENNRIFIEAYGLQDELTPDVPLEEITLTCNPHYRYGGDKSEAELQSLLLADTVKELISYAIGCMMGRYSLDQPGLIYAHSGNDQFLEIYHQKHDKQAPAQDKNHSSNSPAPLNQVYPVKFVHDSKAHFTGVPFQGVQPGCDSWSTFPPDQDGIIPINDTDWFSDDAANRFIEFISVAWPKEHLEENLKFVAENIGPNRGESSRETIRRYISNGFFKHHMKMYKKRPIYWLFASGKMRAFQCLVYLHRYNEGTLSRMRTEYVIPLQGKISARIEQLSGDISAPTSTVHRKKLERERDKLAKQQAELQTFDEKLRHYADQRIILDLDDGVKVNYGKFGDLLAEVKAVTGKEKE